MDGTVVRHVSHVGRSRLQTSRHVRRALLSLRPQPSRLRSPQGESSSLHHYSTTPWLFEAKLRNVVACASPRSAIRPCARHNHQLGLSSAFTASREGRKPTFPGPDWCPSLGQCSRLEGFDPPRCLAFGLFLFGMIVETGTRGGRSAGRETDGMEVERVHKGQRLINVKNTYS